MYILKLQAFSMQGKWLIPNSWRDEICWKIAFLSDVLHYEFLQVDTSFRFISKLMNLISLEFFLRLNFLISMKVFFIKKTVMILQNFLGVFAPEPPFFV